MPDLDFSKLPNHAWILDDVVDLGDLAAPCQRCDTEIRYQHHCHHPMGLSAIVGCICCGDITGDVSFGIAIYANGPVANKSRFSWHVITDRGKPSEQFNRTHVTQTGRRDVVKN